MPRSSAGAGDRLAVEQDLPPAGAGESAEEIEQSGLAATAGADEDQELPVAHVDGDVLDGGQRNPGAPAGELLAHPVEGEFDCRVAHLAATASPVGPLPGWYFPLA